jgi:hypothetical protein
VKKPVWLDFRNFKMDGKCMPMLPRTFIGHPDAIFFADEFTPILIRGFFTASLALGAGLRPGVGAATAKVS